jgi:hypothetical protein
MLLDHDLLVEEHRAGKSRRLLLAHQAESFKRRPFAMDAVLNGQELVLTLDGGRQYVVSGLAPARTGRGILQLYLVDKMRGTARVERVDLDFEPLAKAPRPPARAASRDAS